MVKQQLVCMQCLREGPVAPRMAEARQLARNEGWQTRTVIAGWDNDYCADCARQHPRITCDGDRKPCSSRAIYTLAREKDGKTIHACGAHISVLLGQITAGNLEVKVSRTQV